MGAVKRETARRWQRARVFWSGPRTALFAQYVRKLFNLQAIKSSVKFYRCPVSISLDRWDACSSASRSSVSIEGVGFSSK